MRKIITIAAFLLAFVSMSAQTAERFEQRYNLIVDRLGHDGVGVETVLNAWEKVDSVDSKMLVARFKYYFAKSQTDTVIKKSQKKYLGKDPLLSLKDSVYYFQDINYDDALFASCLKTVDKLIRLYPDQLDYRFLKADALSAYEKESQEMTLSYLLELAEDDVKRIRPWNVGEVKQDKSFFPSAMHDYCYTFYAIGSQQSMKAFLTLSEKMYKLHPDKVDFLRNIGTYHLVAESDPKTALKYYEKVLKSVKDDQASLTNCLIAARKLGNQKKVEKYRALLVKYGYYK